MAKVVDEYMKGTLLYRKHDDGTLECRLDRPGSCWLISRSSPTGNFGDTGPSERAFYMPREARAVYRPSEAADPNGLDAHDPGAKLDSGKVRWDLLDLNCIEGLASVLTYGAEKYSENGWREVPEAEKRYFSAMMRHYKAMLDGEEDDPESGLPHRYHFLTNAMFLCHFFGLPR